MKQNFRKPFIAMILVICMCFLGAGSVFASSDDISITDLLQMLGTLTGDDTGTDDQQTTPEPAPEDTVSHTQGPYTFRIPKDWDNSSTGEMIGMFFSPDFSDLLMTIYADVFLDVNDDKVIDSIISELEKSSDDLTVNDLGYVTVCGNDSAWITLTSKDSDLYVLLVPSDNCFIEFVYTVMDGTEDIGDFLHIIESIEVKGAAGETDLKGLFGMEIKPHTDVTVSGSETACVYCGGDGNCFFCFGEGQVINNNNEYEDCFYCHGTGVCQACEGTGVR